MDQILLEMKTITKKFTGVTALSDVNMLLHRHEILALLGENGAGKSTLMKILAGVHQPTSGEIYIRGEKVRIHDTKHSQALGVSIIYQEFNLIPDLCIAENIYLGREPKRFGIIQWKRLHAQTMALLQRVGLAHLSPKALVRTLSVAEQQLVEIAKSLSVSAEIIIMDEPTAALNNEDTDRLLGIMRDLRAKGLGVIFITHRLEEVKAVADRITVLRDGKYIGSHAVKEASKDDMIKMMVGRDIKALFPEKGIVKNETILTVSHLTVKHKLHDINFTMNKGEVLGVAGLLGSGKTDLSRALFGLFTKMDGNIQLGNNRIRSPRDAIDAGVALVTDDRKQEGLILDLSVYENILLPAYRKISRFGFISGPEPKKIVKRWIKDMSIKVHHAGTAVKNLSGGNQQKVVLSKWLQLNPKLLILNEPTRGIDIGAKVEIYHIIKELADQGVAILLISSEMPELLGLSHRILVMHQGRITAELEDQDATQEKIFYYASGGDA